MKPYLAIFRVQLFSGLQYRTALLGGMLSRFAWGGMEILAYATILSGGATLPMDMQRFASYVWMQQALFALFSVVFADGDIFAAISGGGVAYEMARPLGLYGLWYARVLAARLAATVLQCLPVAVIALLLPAPYGLALPDLGSLFLFLFSMILAALVVAAIAMLMHGSLFYTLSHRGMKIIVTAITSFFSGGLIPLSLFPDALSRIANGLPFAAMQSTPLRIFCGELQGSAALCAMGLQVFWLAVLVLLGRAVMARAVQRVVVQGG